MYCFLVPLLAFVMSLQAVFTRMYNRKLEANIVNSSLFTLARTLIITVFFLVLCKFKPVWHAPTVRYAFAYGAMLSINLIACTMAYLTGPFALTSLLISASMLLVILSGVFFLHESVTLTMGIGITLFMFSLLLLYEKNTDDRKLTPSWWIYTALAFFCNAGCTFAQKLHQTRFPYQFQNDFMFFGAALAAVLCAAFCFAKRVRAIQFKNAWKNGWLSMLGVGIVCSLVNLLLMILNAKVSVSLLYPTVSGLCLLIAALFSKFVYHEKTTFRQKVSYMLGVCSVILMNL